MGKKGRNNTGSKPGGASGCGSQPSVQLTVREELTGKKKHNVNPKSMLKLDHLKNLAVWASGENSVPQFATFFGQRLAASAEALGVPADPSLFSCQRCESILQPGDNCTVRIEKNKSKRPRHKKSKIPCQNNVVYRCHFCSYKNLIRGTPRGYLKEICPPKVKPPSKPNAAKSKVQKLAEQETIGLSNDGQAKVDIIMLPDVDKDDTETVSPATPSPSTSSVKPGTTLLDSKRRKRNRPGSKKPAESESTSATTDPETVVRESSKRRRKGWTSLKDIVESSEKHKNRNATNMSIPFLI